MNQGKQDTWWNAIWIVALFVASVVCLSIASDYLSERVILKRSNLEKCNQTVFADGPLREEGIFVGHSWFFDEEPTLEELDEKTGALDSQLAETNKEVNQLRQLLGCYFD